MTAKEKRLRLHLSEIVNHETPSKAQLARWEELEREARREAREARRASH